MQTDNLYFGEDAREKLSIGIRKVAAAVGGTMGTSGSNAIIEAIQSPSHYVTNDGFSIANAVHLADPIENMGKNILLESINRANKASGDGSSTTCVLTSAIIEEGNKHLGEHSPMELKRSLEACIPLIEASIERQKREIGVESVGAVAAISAEDEEIGAKIQEIYQEIGKDGIIHWDISKLPEDSYTIGHGITIDGAGFASPYMCDATESGQSTNQIRLKNPKILVTKQKITSASDFESIGAALHAKDIKELIVFCDEVDPLVMPDLVMTRMQRGFRFVLVKMPVLWRDQWYEDLALASGATLIDPTAGLSLRTTTMEHLGTFDHITVTKDETFIDGIQDLAKHIEALETEGTDESKHRASRLNTKTARYFVGAHSDSALSYRRLKCEDAIAASYQALNGGIVAGGGVALLNASGAMDISTVGGQILRFALQAPIKQICANSGIEPYKPVDKMGVGEDPEKGFDSRTGNVVNMFEAHITDPANVVLNAAKNAISVAASILTTNTLVLLPREQQFPQGNPPAYVV